MSPRKLVFPASDSRFDPRLSLQTLPFKGVKDDGSEPKVLIVLNAQRAGGLGGDGVALFTNTHGA